MPRPIEADVHSAFMEFRNAGIFTLPVTPSLPPAILTAIVTNRALLHLTFDTIGDSTIHHLSPMNDDQG